MVENIDEESIILRQIGELEKELHATKIERTYISKDSIEVGDDEKRSKAAKELTRIFCNTPYQTVRDRIFDVSESYGRQLHELLLDIEEKKKQGYNPVVLEAVF